MGRFVNDTWLASLILAHSIWVYPFGILTLGVLALLGYAQFARKSLPRQFPLLNRVFLISLDMQWLLGVVAWAAGQQWQNSAALVSFRHPILMTAVWFMFRHGNRKMKAARDEEMRIKDGFAYYALSFVLLVIGVFQILRV